MSIIEDRIADEAEGQAKSELRGIVRDFVNEIDRWRKRQCGGQVQTFQILDHTVGEFIEDVVQTRMNVDRTRIREAALHRFTTQLQDLVHANKKEGQ